MLTFHMLMTFICILTFSWQLMADVWYYEILNFLKNIYGISNFRKIWVIVLKLHTSTTYRSEIFGIEFVEKSIKAFNFLILNFLKISSKLSNSCYTIPPGTSRKHKSSAELLLQILNTLKDTSLVQIEG